MSKADVLDFVDIDFSVPVTPSTYVPGSAANREKIGVVVDRGFVGDTEEALRRMREQKHANIMAWIPENVEATAANLEAVLGRTEEERQAIIKAPQRSDAWHKARTTLMTGSKAGSAAGHNDWETPDQLITNWLQDILEDNRDMYRGRLHEDTALSMYLQFMRELHRDGKKVVEFADPPDYLDPKFHTIDDVVPQDPNTVSDKPYTIDVQVPGLIPHRDILWMGYSPDGIVTETDDVGLLEIKCPRHSPKLTIRWSYYDQIQYGMFQLGLKWCDFVEWNQYRGTQIKRYAFNRRYWEEDLFPKIKAFYFDQLLPAAADYIREERGQLPLKRRKTLDLRTENLPSPKRARINH